MVELHQIRKPQVYRKPDFSVLRRGYERHYYEIVEEGYLILRRFPDTLRGLA